LFYSKVDIKALGGGLATDIVNTVIALLKPHIQKDILNSIEDNTSSTLKDVLVDFDIREIVDL
jgi:hypothetical protein